MCIRIILLARSIFSQYLYFPYCVYIRVLHPRLYSRAVTPTVFIFAHCTRVAHYACVLCPHRALHPRRVLCLHSRAAFTFAHYIRVLHPHRVLNPYRALCLHSRAVFMFACYVRVLCPCLHCKVCTKCRNTVKRFETGLLQRGSLHCKAD